MATDTEGVPVIESFSDAVEHALAQVDEATSTDDESTLPVDESASELSLDQVEEEDDVSSDQPEVQDEFDFDLPEDESTSDAPEPSVIEVDGVQYGVGEIQALLEGNLRQEDYTRKTQELAELRREMESRSLEDDKQSTELWNALRDDAAGTVAYLAIQLGLIDADDARVKVNQLKDVRFMNATDIEEAVTSRLESAVAEHPAIREAQATAVRAAMATAWTNIEGKVGKPLSDRAKAQVLEFATRNNIHDLEIAFDAYRARQAPRDLSNSQPQKRRPSGEAPQPEPEVNSFKDAVAVAEARIASSART